MFLSFFLLIEIGIIAHITLLMIRSIRMIRDEKKRSELIVAQA